MGSGREKHLGMAPGDWEQLALRKQLRGGNGLRHPGWRATIPGGNGRAGDAPGMCRRSQLGLWDKSPPLEGFCGVGIPPGAVLEGRQGFPRGIFWSFPANPGKFWLLAPIQALCCPPELGCYNSPLSSSPEIRWDRGPRDSWEGPGARSSVGERILWNYGRTGTAPLVPIPLAGKEILGMAPQIPTESRSIPFPAHPHSSHGVVPHGNFFPIKNRSCFTQK